MNRKQKLEPDGKPVPLNIKETAKLELVAIFEVEARNEPAWRIGYIDKEGERIVEQQGSAFRGMSLRQAFYVFMNMHSIVSRREESGKETETGWNTLARSLFLEQVGDMLRRLPDEGRKNPPTKTHLFRHKQGKRKAVTVQSAVVRWDSEEVVIALYREGVQVASDAVSIAVRLDLQAAYCPRKVIVLEPNS